MPGALASEADSEVQGTEVTNEADTREPGEDATPEGGDKSVVSRE